MYRVLRLSKVTTSAYSTRVVGTRTFSQYTRRTPSQRNAWMFGGLVAITGGFYITHLETVPQTGRRRFITVTPLAERAIAAEDAATVVKAFRNQILPRDDERTTTVVRVGRKVTDTAEGFFPPPHVQPKLNWSFTVIDDPEKNAFVLPGGQVFVFTGLLDMLPNDEALAGVLAHESAHVVLRHGGERLSHEALYSFAHWAMWFLGYHTLAVSLLARTVDDILVSLPHSRKLELEADRMALDIMAAAKYDPKAYPKLFMSLEQKSTKVQPVELLSTHPSDERRVREMVAYLTDQRYIDKKDSDKFFEQYYVLSAP